MHTTIKLSYITTLLTLSSLSSATPEQTYQSSEKNLNAQYTLIQSYVKDTPTEKNALLSSQRQWLKTRNNQCNVKDSSPLNTSNLSCLIQENNQRVLFFKTHYFNFDSLEKNLIRPITYNSKGEKVLENNECFCDGQMMKINNNKLYIYAVCDEKLKEPKIYNIVKKVKTETSVEYVIATNNNQVANLTLSFVPTGQNAWKIIPKVNQQKTSIDFNFSKKYTTAPQIKKVKQDCGDFDG